MNCSVCGNPLLFDRTIFHCSCGAFVHSYCWDAHILQAHKPSFEIGSVDLNGEFRPQESGTSKTTQAKQLTESSIDSTDLNDESITSESETAQETQAAQPTESVAGSVDLNDDSIISESETAQETAVK